MNSNECSSLEEALYSLNHVFPVSGYLTSASTFDLHLTRVHRILTDLIDTYRSPSNIPDNGYTNEELLSIIKAAVSFLRHDDSGISGGSNELRAAYTTLTIALDKKDEVRYVPKEKSDGGDETVSSSEGRK